MIQSRKKVLIVAYAYEPNKTSEPGVGWHFAHEIAKFMDVTVLTRANNRSAIESEVDSSTIEYVYYDLSKFWTKLKKRIPLGTQMYYALWQWGAYLKLRRALKRKKENYDLVHHLTFGIVITVPPAYLINIPFVWGPVGGGESIPYNFLIKMKLGSIIGELFYSFAHFLSHISPLVYLTRKKANAIIFRTSTTAKHFHNKALNKTYLISETAMPEINVQNRIRQPSQFLNVICIGRIIRHKGYKFGLRGFHNFLQSGGKGKLSFFGTGPDEKYLKSYVADHSLEDYVEFKGFVGNEVVQTALSISHVLLHPSFRDGGSWAIMEAMSYGLPVICLNTSGPKDMVTDNCGLLINLTSPEQVYKDIGSGLIALSSNRNMYNQYSRNAASRIANEYNWDRRREQIKKVYDVVLSKV